MFLGVWLVCGWSAWARADAPRDEGSAPTDAPAAPAADAGAPTDEPATDEPATEPGKHHKHHEHDAAAAVDGDPSAPPLEKPHKKKKKKHGHLDFGGRVLIRGAAVKEKTAPDTVAQGTINSARVKAEYRWHDLRAEVEVELAGKPRLKNAFAQLRLADGATKVDLRAGNFKMPFSAIQLTSIWSLPMADRGLLDNILVRRLQVAGRAVGAMATIAHGGPWSPELRAGVFQGTDDGGTPLAAPARDRFGMDGVVRLTVEPTHGLTIGAAGSARVGELLEVPATVSRGYAGELDATLDVDAGPGHLTVWLEGMVGTSWLVAGSDPTHRRATFAEGRGIAGWRLGGAKHGKRFYELYGVFGALDPDATIQHDAAIEATGGVTLGAWDAWRVQLELERWQVASNAPIGIVELGIGPTTSTTALIQLGARL